MQFLRTKKESLCLLILTLLLILVAALYFISWDKLTRVVHSLDDPKLPELIIASDEFEPYIYLDPKGQFAGVDVELMTEVCRRIGYTPAFHLINWDNKDLALNSGQIDCLAGAFSMNGRENIYLWAGPYMFSRQVVMVPEHSDIVSLADLTGKKVSVQNSGKAEEYFTKADPSHPKVKSVLAFSTIEEAVLAMRKGYVQAVAGHESALLQYSHYDGEKYRILHQPILAARLGVAFKRNGDEGLANAVREAQKAMAADGTTAKIIAKYGLDPEVAMKGGAHE